MTPKTKAILKTTGAVLAGAIAFGYLPLVSFAVAPQVMGWVHMGLAAIHPLLGEGLLAGGCLAGVGLSLKRTWSKYIAEKNLEKKVEKIVAEKMAHRQKEVAEKQKENQRPSRIDHREVAQKDIDLTAEKEKPVKRSAKARLNLLWLRHNRKQQRRDAA